MPPATHTVVRPAAGVTSRPARAVALAAVACLLQVVALPASAAAAITVDPAYTSAAMPDACIGFGQSDQNGVLYAACATKVMRWDRYGAALPEISLAGMGLNGPLDVAPSPDGRFLYVTQGANAPRRLNRGNTGAYTLDAAWRLGQFLVWNVPSAPIGHAIETDGRGDIYVSNAARLHGYQRSIAKYSPDGTFITAFGDWGREPGNWVANQGFTVSRDGRRVYVGENCGTNCIYGTAGYDGSRVTRYDFTAGGTYRFSRIVSAQGPYNGRPFADCPDPGAVHSAYAVALDYWDNLYVTSTTCHRIQVFATDADPAKDRFVKSLVQWPDAPGRNHYLMSDWAGRLYAREWNRVFRPTNPRVPALPLPALAPLPAPDVVAPVLRAITLPAGTTTRDVEVGIDATDDVAVAELQLAREDGTWGPWQPYAPAVTYRLSDGYGVKGVYVRVRDMAGNESNAVYRTLTYVAPVDGDAGAPPPPVGDAADPVLTSITVPALTATQVVQVQVEATDDVGVRHVRLANEDGNWAAWQPFAAVVDWQLSANVGAKAVYVQVRDGAGRESAALLARTRWQLDAPPPPPPGDAQQPDTVAPTLAGITLPAETTTQAVTVTLDAADDRGVAQVRLANEDGNWTAWRAWAPTQQWQLTANHGGKLVYAQVRDAAGNESGVKTARTTFVRTVAGPVDAADPALQAVILPATVPTQDVRVRLEATDDVGVTQVRFANEDGNWGAWAAFAPDVAHRLTPGNTWKVVYAQVRDAAGRESNVLFARTLVAP